MKRFMKISLYAVLAVVVVLTALIMSSPQFVLADGGQWNRGRHAIWAEWEFMGNQVANAASAWLFKGTTEFDGTADFDGATTFDSTIDVQGQTITATGATIQGSGTAIMDGVGKTVTSIAAATTVTTLDLTTADEIIYVADGRTASLTVTLPEASTWVGHTYTIVLADDSTNSLIVDIAAADRFLLCNAAGDGYSTSTMGGTIMASAIGYTDIAAVTVGTWADAE